MNATAQQSAPDQVPDQITIGGLFPLTGSLALGGIEREAAFRMAIREINADPTILPNHELVGITADSGTNSTKGVAAAKTLINQGASVLIGASSSSVSQAIAVGPATTNHIPQISYSSTSPVLSDKDTYPYFVRVVPSDGLQTRALLELVQSFNWDLISIIRSANLYGQGVSQGVTGSSSESINLGVTTLQAEAERLNIRVSQNREIRNSADITKTLQRIKLFGSNIILLNVYLEDAIHIFESAHELGMTAANGYVWIGSDASTQLEILEANSQVQTAMQGMIGLKPLQPTGTLYQDFIDLWQNCAGANQSYYPGCGDRTPNFYAPFAYDATYLAAHALDQVIKTGGSPDDGESVLQQLYDVKFTGVTGDIELNQQGDRIMGYDVVNVQQSNIITVGDWNPITGFTQDQAIHWTGDPNSTQGPPQARLASSWILLLSVVIIPMIIYIIRKIIERWRNDV